MDDLKMLRELGRDLAEEPPATLARQRQRLLNAATPRHRRPRPRSWLTLAAAAGVTAALAVTPAVLLTSGAQDPSRPDDAARPGPYKTLNVLVIGSDGRGHRKARSDTVVLTHLPADRKQVTSVSLPRDLLIRIPPCRDAPAPTGTLGSVRLACARTTVEAITNVRIDHVVEVDFAGLKGMVNALGGVEVKVSKPIDDPKSQLRLPAGRHPLNGDQALAYVRTRYTPDGSDLGRIRRQQSFMAAMLTKAKAQLTNPVRLARFLAVAAQSIKTDSGLSLPELTSIARSLDKTDPAKVRFVTVPVRPAQADPNRLELKQPAAGELFARLR